MLALLNESEQDDENYQDEFMSLPSSRNAIIAEAQSLGLFESSSRGRYSLGRQQLLAHVYDSHKIKRSYKQMSILLVGPSGVGKSETVNHLFNLKRKNELEKFASTSREKSETRSVTEYVLKTSSVMREVKDLVLGIVDSPGINDTSGTKQDACNFYAIKRFYSEHPNLKGCFPNLIFVLITAGDRRTGGPNSALSRTLKLLSRLKLVDKAHPNVVGIITHAMILGSKRTKYLKEFLYLSTAFKGAIFEHLGVRAPVVAIENDIEGEELEVENDWTLLVDGTRQPLNLFNRCINLLRKSGDPFGQLIFSESFRECFEPKIGFLVAAKDATIESLCSEEKEFHNEYQLSMQGGIDDDIILMANIFIACRSLSEDQIKIVRTLANKLTAIGFTLEAASDFSIGSLRLISECGQLTFPAEDFLRTLHVAEKQEIDICHSAIRVIGQGFNILTNQIVPLSIFSFDKRETEYGIVVPDIAELARVNETFEFMELFKNDEEMFKARMKSLNVNLTNISRLLSKSFGIEGVGYNKIATTNHDPTSMELSFFLEQRLFELRLADLSKLKPSDDFCQNVEKLPQDFDSQNTQARYQFEPFFQKWGHFFVAQAYGGGSVEMKFQAALEANFIDAKTVKAILLASFSGNSFDRNKFNENQKLFSNLRAEWKGGHTHLHSKETLFSEELMNKWKMSLIKNPVMLEHSMKLLPVYEIVAKIDKKKGIACMEALRDLLGEKIDLEDSEQSDQTSASECGSMQTNFEEEPYLTREEAANESNPGKKGKCFPPDASVTVRLNNKDYCVQMKSLKVGDRVKTIQNGRIVYQKIVTFLHRDLEAKCEFLKLTFDTGDSLTLTGNHLIMTRKGDSNAISSKPASQVQVDDEDLITIREENEGMKVVKVECEWNSGIFCPLTESGTIVVDGVLCSCYASVRSLDFRLFHLSGHKLAHLVVSPLRFWRRISSWECNEKMEKYLKFLQNLRISKMVTL